MALRTELDRAIRFLEEIKLTRVRRAGLIGPSSRAGFVEDSTRVVKLRTMPRPKDGRPRSPDDSKPCSRLLCITSVFGRLIYVASLASEAGGSDGDSRQQAVRAEHQVVFEDWLAMKFRDKQADMAVCAADLGRSVSVMMRDWIQPRHQGPLIPASALGPQRELFNMELEVLFLVI